jgi:hypothetical protein
VPQLQEIVQVDITRETSRITQVGFGRALLAVSGFEDATSDKVREYSTLAEVLEDFASDSTAYAGAAAYFGQQRRPASLLIGEYDSADPVASLNAIDAVNPDWYCLLVADDSPLIEGESRIDRLISIAAWIETQERICIIGAFGAETLDDSIGDDDASLTALLHAAGYTRTATIWTGESATEGDTYGPNQITNGDFASGTGWTTAAGSAAYSGGQAQLTASGGGSVGITRLQSLDAGTYLLSINVVSATSTQGTLEMVVQNAADSYSGPVETGTISMEIEITSEDSGIIGFAISGTAGAAVFVIDNFAIRAITPPSMDVSGPAAWAGRMLPTDPGSQTWAHKRLIGVESANLSTAQRTNLFAKKGNLLSTIAGLSNTRYGTMASGEFIDIIRGIDWLVQRMREDIFRAFVNTGKIPYTGAGIAAIENIVRARLRIAQGIGLIAPDTATVPGFNLTVPAIGDT